MKPKSMKFLFVSSPPSTHAQCERVMRLARSQFVCVELSVYNHVDCCLLELEQ